MNKPLLTVQVGGECVILNAEQSQALGHYLLQPTSRKTKGRRL